jgi:hypothetical protein
VKYVVVAASLLVSCGDPVHDKGVDALGPETFGLRPGPTHRPGQPCLVCHGGSGPGSPEFSVAGTVYKYTDTLESLQGADVVVTDANGASRTFTTNQTGNFYVGKKDWDPVFPLHVKVNYKSLSIEMQTHVGRDGACASCHFDPAGPSAVGHVYLVGDPKDFPK